jgi:glucose/arabinose dehydrogenase
VIAVAAIAGACVLVPDAGAADLNQARVRLLPVATKLKDPLALAWKPGDAQMYVAEQKGRIRPIINGRPKGKTIKIPVSKGGEQGLLGMAFSANGQKLYVSYTDKAGDSRVDEYPMNGRVAVKQARRRVLSIDRKYDGHNGGQVTFGPDGMLYLAFGDGGAPETALAGDPDNNAQRKNTLLGKILRINPNPTAFASYLTPGTNPFFAEPGARREIWMYGLRNPWRFSFDRVTGDFWVGDVGQDFYEEINFAPAGQSGTNWGWRLREGAHAYVGAAPPGAQDPIIERPHSAGNCAITGGYVYRGTRIPNLVGAYVYGDFCTGLVYAAVQQGGVITQSRVLGFTVPRLTSFGEDPSGELYAVARSGTVYKLVP